MHQYKLQKYEGLQSRYRCPACQNRRKTFSLYINTQTNEPLNAMVGRCSRENKCGYHYTPKMWFGEKGEGVHSRWTIDHGKKLTTNQPKAQSYGPSTMDYGLLKQSLKHYQHNNLITYLTHTLGADTTQTLIERYRIGTAKHWPGATVFWQIDVSGKIRTGKIMLYNKTTGKRVKQPFNHITWAHTLLRLHNFELQQCFFGEHLLPGNTKPVGIVESEKTAIIASAFLPKLIWLAAGSLGNLSAQKCSILKGRKVYLFPDINAFTAWQNKASQLSYITGFKVSGLLQHIADDGGKAKGLDLADYLVANHLC
jgi:hypothetical protein